MTGDGCLCGAAVIKPGDKVLLGVDGDVSADMARRMLDALSERFPGVEFTIVDARVEAVMS